MEWGGLFIFIFFHFRLPLPIDKIYKSYFIQIYTQH